MLLLHAVIDADWTMNLPTIKKYLKRLKKEKDSFKGKCKAFIESNLLINNHVVYLNSMKDRLASPGIFSLSDIDTLERVEKLTVKCDIFKTIHTVFFGCFKECKKIVVSLQKEKEACKKVKKFLQDNPDRRIRKRLVERLATATQQRKEAAAVADRVIRVRFRYVQTLFQEESAIAQDEAEMGVNPVIFTERELVLRQ